MPLPSAHTGNPLAAIVQQLRSVEGVFGTPWLESQAYLLGVAIAVSILLLLTAGRVSLSDVLVYTLICGNVTTVGNALLRPFYGRSPFWSWFVFACVQLPLAVLGGFLGSALNAFLSPVARGRANVWHDMRFAVTVTLLLDIVTFHFVRARNRLRRANEELVQQVEFDQQELLFHTSELSAAFDIQSRLLPQIIPQINGVEISCAWQPARTVSGDFFDVVVLSQTQIAVCLADVSGKGLSAALVTANLQAAFRAFLAGEARPSVLCRRLNEALCANLPQGRFVTVVYGVLDTASQTFTYETAGHAPPLLLRRRETLRLEGSGSVLGLLPAAGFADHTIKLQKGDCLLLITDGVTEAFDAADEEFGEDRVIHAARAALSEDMISAPTVRSRIMSAVSTHAVHGFHDDASVMVLCIG